MFLWTKSGIISMRSSIYRGCFKKYLQATPFLPCYQIDQNIFHEHIDQFGSIYCISPIRYLITVERSVPGIWLAKTAENNFVRNQKNNGPSNMFYKNFLFRFFWKKIRFIWPLLIYQATLRLERFGRKIPRSFFIKHQMLLPKPISNGHLNKFHYWWQSTKTIKHYDNLRLSTYWYCFRPL